VAYLAVGWRLVHRAAVAAPVRGYDEQLWTQVKAGIHYLVLQVVPVHLSVDHQFLISDSLADPFAVAAVLLWASLLVLTWQTRARDRLPLFLLLWWGVALAPASLVPLNVLVNEHRLYLSTGAAALALGSCWTRIDLGGSARRWSPVLAAVGLIILVGLTLQRSRVWASDYALWSDAATKAPMMARPYIFLAEAHARDGHDPEAIRAYEEAVRRDPGFAVGYARIGELLLRSGEGTRARAVLETGLARAGDTVELWTQLAELFRAEERWPECTLALERAVGLSPEDAGLRNNLGNAYQMIGRGHEALAQHAQADRLAPGDPRTWLNTGNAHLMLGEYPRAEEAFRRAVSLDPGFAPAWISLGAVLERAGKRQEALAAYQQGAAVDPAWGAHAAEHLRALDSTPEAGPPGPRIGAER
jgi:tetratricopeptide (TPR) repeat protein